jgi:hypothetical protein
MTTLTIRDAGDTPADHATDHNTLHTAYNDQTLWFPANALTPTGSAVRSTETLTLPNGSTRGGQISHFLGFPEDWTTYHVDALWVQASPEALNYVFRTTIAVGSNTVAGAWTSVASAVFDVTVAGPNNAAVFKRSRVVTARTVNHNGLELVRVERVGSDAADTGVANVALYGLLLVKAS